MNANELRTGNYILNDGVVVQADGRTIFDIWSGTSKKYEPIPLTEEWLIKFGFVRQGKRDMWVNDKVLLNTSFANEVQDIIRQELNPGYTAQTWCGKCCADMLELAFRHLDSLPKDESNT